LTEFGSALPDGTVCELNLPLMLEDYDEDEMGMIFELGPVAHA
jgi:hypothetical protein